jgi:hypothetical protein
VLAQRDELRGRFLQQAERVDKWLTDDLPQVVKEQAEPLERIEVMRLREKNAKQADPTEGNPSY